MASTINFSSAFIRTVSMALDEGTKRIRINVSASLTKEVREKMEWLEPTKPKGNGRTIDDAATSIDLEGELQGRTMTLKPNDKELQRHACEIEVSEVGKFCLVTVKENESTRKELRFQILTTQRGALGKIEKYTDAVGQAKAELRISHVKQEELPLGDVTASDQKRMATAPDSDNVQ